MKTQIEKHEKAIRVLEAIKSLNARIAINERYSDKLSCGGFDVSHLENRVDIDNKIKDRLQNYYNNFYNLKN